MSPSTDDVHAHVYGNHACYRCERDIPRDEPKCPDCGSVAFYTGLKPCQVIACADADINSLDELMAL